MLLHLFNIMMIVMQAISPQRSPVSLSFPAKVLLLANSYTVWVLNVTLAA